jgi:hypothetical protein
MRILRSTSSSGAPSFGGIITSGSTGIVRPPVSNTAAAATPDPLNTDQVFAKIGEPIPIVFARFRNSKGGILISPAATEARYEVPGAGQVTASYHFVISEGQVDSIQVRDVLQSSCRVGTHTQTYDRRAGSWIPGNVTNNLNLGAPISCGTIGTYPGLSTLSFTNTIPYGRDEWKRQVHLFIRGGMYVQRLYDNVFGPSDNFADLIKWLLENTARVPAALIDTAGFTTAATFLEYNSFTCNCELKESTNLPNLLAEWGPYFLLCESSNGGKKFLRPLVPTLSSGAINTGQIVDEYTFTENTVIAETFEIEYIPLGDRQPFVVQAMWRQQLEGDIGIIRTHERRYTGTAETGPYESHDLSAFCTNEDHAAKVAAYILAKRVYPTHTVRFVARPQVHNTILSAGSIIRVRLEREATNYVASVHDFFYQVTTITETLAGDVSYEAVHFPVDDQGRSLIALDVAAAVGSGTLLTNNRTAPSCDVNSPGNTNVPSEDWSPPDPVPDPPNSNPPSGNPGTGGFGDTPPPTPPTLPDDGGDQSPQTQPFPDPATQFGDTLDLGAAPNSTDEWTFGSSQDGWQPFSYGTIRSNTGVVIGSNESSSYPNGGYTIRATRTNTLTGAKTIYEQYIPSNPGTIPGLHYWFWTAAGGTYGNRSYYPAYPYRQDRINEPDGIQRYDVVARVGGPPPAPVQTVGPFRDDSGGFEVQGAYDQYGILLISYT